MPIRSNHKNMQITFLSLSVLSLSPLSLWSLVTTEETELVSIPLLLLA